MIESVTQPEHCPKPEAAVDESAPFPPAPSHLRRALIPGACLLALIAASGPASACDGKSYAFSIAVGANVDGGGLTVRLDKAKFIDEKPDKYYVSVKDDGNVLADHAPLKQFDTLSLKTRCGTVSIGADRKSMFSNHTLALTWSYF